MKSQIIRTIIFILIGILLFGFMNILFMPEWMKPEDVTLVVRGFYEEKENSLDVLFIGDSNIYCGVTPMKIWKDYGITSYNISSSEQKVWTSYYMLKEALKYQKPKLIVIDSYMMFCASNSANALVRQALDNMKLDEVKLEAINDPIYNLSSLDKLSYIFPIIEYHTRWNRLNENDFRRIKNNYKNYCKGYIMYKEKKYTGHRPDEAMDIVINDNSKKYMEKIIELCKKNNIEILFTKIPTTEFWVEEQHNAMVEYCKEKDFSFIDMNNNSDIQMDWINDTFDDGVHLNVYGSEKVSAYIGKYISENYKLENHKDDEKYSNWNEDLQKYEEKKACKTQKNI